MRTVLVVAVVACTIPHNAVRVTLRDPTLIEVRAVGQPIVAVGEPRGTIPTRAFLIEPRADAYVERGRNAELAVWCPHCTNVRHRRIIGGCVNESVDGEDRPVCHELAPPVVTLEGSMIDVVHADGADLHMRYRFDESERWGRRGTYEWPRIELELVTPRANVVSIVPIPPVMHPDDRATGRAIAWVTTAMAVLGAGLLARGETHDGHGDAPGAVLLAIGGVVSPLMWLESHVHDRYAALPP